MPITKQNVPFGQWHSPIDPAMMSRRTRFEDVAWMADGNGLVWQEGRGGQGVLVYQAKGDARRDLCNEYSVRGGVGYGGAGFTTANGAVFFVDQGRRLMRKDLPFGKPYAITPEYGGLAAPCISPDGRWVTYVYSDGQTDLLAIVDALGKEWPARLVSGADFYMQPAWHPSGKQLAWVEWDHPNMPWRATRLVLADLEGELPKVSRSKVIAAQPDGVYTQPQFSPDGRWLSYLAGEGEWENLVLVDLVSGETRILYQGEHKLLSTPAWVQGVRSYGWNPNSSTIFSLWNYAGSAGLVKIEIAGGKVTPIDTAPYTWLDQLSVSPSSGALALVASAPNLPERVVCYENGAWRCLAYNDAWMFDPENFSRPEQVEWQSLDGGTVFGNFYAPSNPGFSADGLPALVVYVHGGPSSQTPLSFSPTAQFFTTRGYAFLEVNYHGSSGYGRSYLAALDRRWGEVDTADIVSGAKAMAERGLVDPARMVIMGGSAGGFAVLNALYQYPGAFKAGIAMYPVADLISIDLDTHKFEAHYTKSLVGKLPDDLATYRARSALYHADEIRGGLIIFHGMDDRVVPVSQSQTIVARMRAGGFPVDLHTYAGEGHGFRKPETIRDVYEKIERFMITEVLYGGRENRE